MTVALLILATLCGLVVVYPFAIYPLVLRTLPRREIVTGAPREVRFTLLFCAYNEGPSLAAKLRNIEQLRSRYPTLEVLAYDDGSDDDTLRQLMDASRLLTVVTGEGRRGKAHGMKILAARAGGDVLVFTDANVTLAVEALTRLQEVYRDPAVGGVCGALHYVNAGESSTASVGSLYWRLEERIKALESLTGNVMGADGSIFSVRRELYPDFPDSVLDDFTVSMSTVFAGRRLVRAEDVIAYERLVVERGDEFARKIRIAARAFHTHRHLRPQLAHMRRIDKFKYYSHKMTRWFGGLFLVMGAVFGVVGAFTVSAWLGLGVLALMAMAALSGVVVRRGPMGAATDAVLALLATLIGVLQASRGRTYVTWSPAKSR